MNLKTKLTFETVLKGFVWKLLIKYKFKKKTIKIKNYFSN